MLQFGERSVRLHKSPQKRLLIVVERVQLLRIRLSKLRTNRSLVDQRSRQSAQRVPHHRLRQAHQILRVESVHPQSSRHVQLRQKLLTRRFHIPFRSRQFVFRLHHVSPSQQTLHRQSPLSRRQRQCRKIFRLAHNGLRQTPQEQVQRVLSSSNLLAQPTLLRFPLRHLSSKFLHRQLRTSVRLLLNLRQLHRLLLQRNILQHHLPFFVQRQERVVVFHHLSH